MNRMYACCGGFLMLMAAGGYGWGYAFGHPLLGMVLAGLGPLALAAFVWILAFFQDVWLPVYPRCHAGKCVGMDGYDHLERTEGATKLKCQCGDVYVCSGERSKGRTMERVMPDGNTVPFKSHGKHGRWKVDDETMKPTERPPYFVECLREFKWWRLRRKLRREWINAVADLGLGARFGDEICWTVGDGVFATLYLWENRLEDTSIQLKPCLYFRLRDVEKVVMGELEGSREAISQIGTIGFALKDMFGAGRGTPWVLSGDDGDQAVLDGFCTMLKDEVVPFAANLVTAEAFADLILTKADAISIPMSHYRAPVIFLLAANLEEAESRIQKGLAQTADWNGYSKALYQSYVERLRTLMADFSNTRTP